MAVQGVDKRTLVCERCFAAVPATEAFCSECGAAMSEGSAEGSDAAVYPELARANLLRMRGDYKVAEEQCLAILRRYPNNATANILLGDISAEKGDLEHAMQWYELALDLMPDSSAARHKLEQVRERFRLQETAATVEQLGLPTTKSRAGVYAVALIASIFVIAVVAYFVGQRVEQKKGATGGVQLRAVEVPGSSGAEGGTGPVLLTAGQQGGAVIPQEDAELLEAIRGKGAAANRVVGAMQDPRSKVIVLTYNAVEGEDERRIGAEIAKEAFEVVPDALVVTIRAMRRGKLVFAADAMRSRYEETLTSTWREANSSNATAWIAHVLSNEWPKRDGVITSGSRVEPPSSGEPSGGTPPPANSEAPTEPAPAEETGAPATPPGGESASETVPESPPGDGSGP